VLGPVTGIPQPVADLEERRLLGAVHDLPCHLGGGQSGAGEAGEGAAREACDLDRAHGVASALTAVDRVGCELPAEARPVVIEVQAPQSRDVGGEGRLDPPIEHV